MAIDYTGRVTTTGLMNQGASNPNIPDMSKMVSEQPEPTQRVPINTAIPEKKVTDEDMAILAPVLSPSVINVLQKLAPDLGPILAQAGNNEENIVLPVSIVKNYALKNYGGNSEDEAVQKFLTDLSNTQMDNTNVPLDTAPQSSGMMARSEPPLPERDDSGVDITQELV